MAEWPDQEMQQVAFVEGSYVMSEEEGVPSLWKLMQRLPPLKWVAIQMFVAGIFAALARRRGWAGRGPTRPRARIGRRPTPRHSALSSAAEPGDERVARAPGTLPALALAARPA